MSRVRPIDLKGKKIGEWEVLEYVGKRKWRCRCSCGNIREVSGQVLRDGRSQSCGHDKNVFIDMTNWVIGEWTVKEYVGESKWKCECSCGKVKIVEGKFLRNERSTSCGHNNKKPKEDLTGQKIGEWEVLEYVGNLKWRCRCSCGNIREVLGSALRNRTSLSCGHWKEEPRYDLKGQKIGEWEVLEYIGGGLWKCRCSCGNIRKVSGKMLRYGETHSCGCKKTERYANTVYERYGVSNIFQLGTNRTEEQLNMITSRENLLDAIINNFDHVPNAVELSELLGINNAMSLRYIHKFGLEDHIIFSSSVSSYENELNELFPCTRRSDRSAVPGNEIDLYYEKHKFGVEFNGNYWHCEIKKDKNYHRDKTIAAARLGIQIFHIFEYEWLNDNTKGKLIKLIRNKLKGTDMTKIYARNCEVKHIKYGETADFLDKFHLQGSTVSSINFGIYYNNKLIGVMTFGKPRFNSEYEYELLRLAWDYDVQVIGGMERLFSHFIQEYNPNSIITYCDASKFTGNSYLRLGFRAEELTEPNYKWVNMNKNIVMSRYQCQKHKLLEAGYGEYGCTEAEIMQNLGYIRIYDCGNIRLLWNSKIN